MAAGAAPQAAGRAAAAEVPSDGGLSEPEVPLSLGPPTVAQPTGAAPQPAGQAAELDEPLLQTASSGLPDPAVIALGVGFLLVVGGGFGFLVWRRAQRG
ncbi:hypothetical protein DMO24_14130 [Modestobacter versicolor]|uniref:Uncharacterized protein n=1 Tax=Modestobacter versicolor TaxID=429133 RepID=A0A323VLU5_9ACTN|nr:hypothetical protein DMO24_14130 [Modestobacter versicolor]